jgi:hypothetical protein
MMENEEECPCNVTNDNDANTGLGETGCILLRVHSSLIQSLSWNGDSEILLPESAIRSTKNSSSIEEDSDIDGKVDKDRITVRKEPSGFTHVFVNSCDSTNKQTPPGQDHSRPQKTFQYSVTALTTHRLVLQPHNTRLKQFGEKARARLVEEKQKRKEIVVLDSVPEGKVEKMNKMRHSTAKTITQEQISTRRKLTLARTSRTTTTTTTRMSNSTSRKRQANNFSLESFQPISSRKPDLWTPNLAHIPIPSGDKRSSFVTLHGLPIGCTPDHIKKFFSGLVVERIFSLLTNRISIPILDASNIAFEHHHKNYLQYQSDRNLLRVLVKFQSPSAAALATDRSGETISAKKPTIPADKASEATESPEAFVIGVTQLSKDLAASLSRLTIEAFPQSTLDSCLSATQSRLPSHVREILWTRAHQECPILPVDTETRKADLLLLSAAETNKIDPMNLFGYQLLARRFNRFVELHNDLTSHLDGVATNGLLLPGKEISAITDPVLRLTDQARRVLEEEMNRIDSILHQVRVARSTDQRASFARDEIV